MLAVAVRPSGVQVYMLFFGKLESHELSASVVAPKLTHCCLTMAGSRLLVPTVLYSPLSLLQVPGRYHFFHFLTAGIC